ncbi:MAG: CDP-glycerol glycerophosphotransferase family protein [Eubacterium sp.]|nr:CDP-glycerol glycerophosphotransferase family protein [Eubacterium sp.]
MKTIKDALRAVMLFYKKILYKIAQRTTKVDDKLVFFESFQGRNYSCNPKGIYQAMDESEDYNAYKHVWAFRDVKSHDYIKSSNTKVVKFESFKYYRALAKAKYWVFNSNTRKFVVPKDNQVFVQTWHGTPLKKIGCDVEKAGNAVTDLEDIAPLYRREAEKISYFISPSKFCTEKLVSAFDLDDDKKVLETGYPRNDELFTATNAEVSSIKKKLGIDEKKHVILYAPTFRDNAHSQITGFNNAIGIDFKRLEQMLGDDYVILFRGHYFISKAADFSIYGDFLIDVSDVEDINELYLASDLLITDYSSVFFDYANLRKPILFYMYDLDAYKNHIRDLYIDVLDLPGPIIEEFDELAEQIKRKVAWHAVDMKYSLFNETYNYLDGPDCGLKVAREIIK